MLFSLEALQGFTFNRKNALNVVKSGFLDDMQKQDLKHPALIEKTLKVLLNLAFVEENLEHFTDGVQEKIRSFTTHQNEEISNLAKRVLFQIGKGNHPDEEKSTCTDGKEVEVNKAPTHVMISYNWTHQELALKLRDHLSAKGQNVWIDVEKMSGDTLQRMAEAVENRHAMISCISNKYFESQPCRQEASYANKLKKKIIFVKVEKDYTPKGWLGIITSSKLHYEAHIPDLLEANIQGILKAIDEEENLQPNKSADGVVTSKA